MPTSRRTAGDGPRAPAAAARALSPTRRPELERELRAFAAGETPAIRDVGHAAPGRAAEDRLPVHRPGRAVRRHGARAVRQRAGLPRALDRAAAILAPQLERPLLEVLFPAEGAATAARRDRATRSRRCSRSRCALAELWRSWGITPSIVAGPQRRRVRRRLRRGRVQPRGRARR